MHDQFDRLFVPQTLDGLVAFAEASMRREPPKPKVKKLNIGPGGGNKEMFDKIPIFIYMDGWDTNPKRPPENPEGPRWLKEGNYVKDTWMRYEGHGTDHQEQSR